jgi:hypothetical protein
MILKYPIKTYYQYYKENVRAYFRKEERVAPIGVRGRVFVKKGESKHVFSSGKTKDQS